MNRRNFLAMCSSAAITANGKAVTETEILFSKSTEPSYEEAIRRTAAMTSNRSAIALAKRRNLQVLNVTWEDTGRYKGSAVGPNISDMTIQVAGPMDANEKRTITSMPVIRHPNFSDRTCDLDPEEFTLLVRNQKGRGLKRVSLRELLAHPTRFLSKPASWKSDNQSLLAERDSKVLVSAQACFLPVPQKGEAEFNPVLFNYQSRKGDPAVLTILATREGTSITVIDNVRDAWREGGVWGQRLFHNQNGERCGLTGKRLSDFRTENSEQVISVGAAGETGLNMVVLIQVPLKQREEMRFGLGAPGAAGGAMKSMEFRSRHSDVEEAVIGHGKVEGPFTEIDNLAITRDARFPVRVTVQFYQATSNGVVSKTDIDRIADQIDRVYSRSNYVGSLVTDGTTGRITEYDGPKVQPPDWWEQFWHRFTANTGLSRDEAILRLQQLLGPRYQVQPVTDLYVRQLLRHPK